MFVDGLQPYGCDLCSLGISVWLRCSIKLLSLGLGGGVRAMVSFIVGRRPKPPEQQRHQHLQVPVQNLSWRCSRVMPWLVAALSAVHCELSETSSVPVFNQSVCVKLAHAGRRIVVYDASGMFCSVHVWTPHRVVTMR